MPRLLSAKPSPAPIARARHGYTLPELLVTMVLLSMVGAALLRTLARQQRFYNHAGEVIEQRSQLRQAASILPVDFRGISTVGRDLSEFGPTRVRMLATFGSSVICRRPVALLGNTFELPPREGAKNTYTMWATAPQPGDTVMILDEGVGRGSDDDRWVRFAVAEVLESPVAGTYCDDPHIYIDAADAGKPRYQVRVALPGNAVTTGAGGAAITTPVPVIPATVVSPGAVVRFVRPVEYSLFQSSQDSKWYLGLSEFRAGGWTARQVVSGPYAAVGGADGLTFRYFTQAGAPVAAGGDPTTIARIDMVLRGASAAKNQFSSSSTGRFADSLAVRVAVRNRQ